MTATTRASVAQAFGAIAPVELARIFRGFGPLPAVVGVRDQTGGWDHVGASRIVELADGSEARERLTVFEPPEHFAYRVGPFTGALGRIVREADGAWWFSPGANGTEIRSTYTFHPKRRTELLIRLIAPLWRGYARRALERAVQLAEATPPAARGG